MKDISDKASALVAYARQAKNPELELMAGEIRLRAKRRIGELSSALETVQGINLPNVPAMERSGKRVALREAGISTSEAQRCEQLAKVPEPQFEAYITASRSAKKVTSSDDIVRKVARDQRDTQRQHRRDENAALVAKVVPVNAVHAGLFSTVVIDPPWDWGDEGDVDQFGRAKPTYSTMSYEEVAVLPVAKLADEDAHLYLWITNRSLPKGFALLAQWGFRYITCLTWCKPHFGMGNYFRGQTEHILFAIRGSQALRRHDVGTWFRADRGTGGHSSKPEKFYELVESCSHGPYLEMFQRTPRANWSGWGADVKSAA